MRLSDKRLRGLDLAASARLRAFKGVVENSADHFFIRVGDYVDVEPWAELGVADLVEGANTYRVVDICVCEGGESETFFSVEPVWEGNVQYLLGSDEVIFHLVEPPSVFDLATIKVKEVRRGRCE